MFTMVKAVEVVFEVVAFPGNAAKIFGYKQPGGHTQEKLQR